MNFGRSAFVNTNDTPRFDMLGDAVGAAKDLITKNEIMGDARRDAAQSFANARIDAAKKGLLLLKVPLQPLCRTPSLVQSVALCQVVCKEDLAKAVYLIKLHVLI